MQFYLYAKSGHSYGLDRVKRVVALYETFKEFDPILCTCDFRAGSFAKEVFGIKKSVSVDLIENLPNIMQRGDVLAFDSDEPSDFMKKNMKDFCSFLIEVGIDTPKIIAHKIFEYNPCTNGKILFFFGDDDYKKELLSKISETQKLSISVLLGHYYFLGNEDQVAQKFSKFYEDTEYADAIKSYEFLLTGSTQAAIESLSCGNKPVFFIRDDKIEDIEDDLLMLKELNIPIIEAGNLNTILATFESIKSDYPATKQLPSFDLGETKSAISKRIEMLKQFQNQTNSKQ